MKNFRLKEDDLKKLETICPALIERMGALMNDPEIQVMAEELKRIVSDVRWDYGPATESISVARLGM